MLTPMAAFLFGVITTSSLVATLFFLHFWKDTRDSFFLAFAASFFIEALNRMATLVFVENPSEGNPVIYLVRLFSFLLILGAILKKNYEHR